MTIFYAYFLSIAITCIVVAYQVHNGFDIRKTFKLCTAISLVIASYFYVDRILLAPQDEVIVEYTTHYSDPGFPKDQSHSSYQPDVNPQTGRVEFKAYIEYSSPQDVRFIEYDPNLDISISYNPDTQTITISHKD